MYAVVHGQSAVCQVPAGTLLHPYDAVTLETLPRVMPMGGAMAACKAAIAIEALGLQKCINSCTPLPVHRMGSALNTQFHLFDSSGEASN